MSWRSAQCGPQLIRQVYIRDTAAGSYSKTKIDAGAPAADADAAALGACREQVWTVVAEPQGRVVGFVVRAENPDILVRGVRVPNYYMRVDL